jgi:hypothetical protein
VALVAEEDRQQGCGGDKDGTEAADCRTRSHNSIISNLLVIVFPIGSSPAEQFVGGNDPLIET